MLKRTALAVFFVALGAGASALVFAGWFVPHSASGTVSSANSVEDSLYICAPDGSIENPICPIDTAGADEDIFVAAENLMAGDVVWQKLRLRNVSDTGWDIASLNMSLIEVSDPGGLCDVTPEGVTWHAVPGPGLVHQATSVPGITVLGKIGGGEPDPGGTSYGSWNDNHTNINGEAQLQLAYWSTGYGPDYRSVHVAPGAYEDVVLGLKLPQTAPSDCLNVEWQVNTTWDAQPHAY